MAMSAMIFVLLDACCLLNLYATRRLTAILETLPMRFVVAETASREALFVYRGGQGPDAHLPEPLDLTHPLQADLLTVVTVESDDEGYDYLAFAAELDDGEAM